MMKKNGFTLLELLVVIVIIGLLATLVVGGASYAMRVSRAKRVSMTCASLKTAIVTYQSRYGKWPGSKKPSKDSKGRYKPVEYVTDNAKVFGPLRVGSKDNPDEIQILEETALFAPGGDSSAVKLSETTGDQPLVYPSRSGRWTKSSGEYFYYKVVIDYEFKTVEVSAPEFEDDGD